MATIKAVDSHTVHRIQSGQVIVDLSSVVKELVENSLDAGATSIDVRFKTQGLDLIEVQDNGDGISPHDYQSIALKHFTSKLSTYEDLASLTTFGFRGEALSSLCAVSKLHITTAREGDAPKGTRLDFDASGTLSGTSVAACPRGTIIAVEDLFRGLPVRRRGLEKNIKREFNKVLALLHAYACVSTGVKFTVSNQISRSSKAVIFATQANATTRENITNVYGSKTTNALIALDLYLQMQPEVNTLPQLQDGCGPGADKHLLRVVGHVSRPVFGEGRLTPDRQMFFVNSRPCSLPQVAKAFNDVYRSFNYSQSPFVFANLIMDTTRFDVNVSPDKRTILLHDQVQLLDSLKLQLYNLFDVQEQTVPISQLPIQSLRSRNQEDEGSYDDPRSPSVDPGLTNKHHRNTTLSQSEPTPNGSARHVESVEDKASSRQPSRAQQPARDFVADLRGWDNAQKESSLDDGYSGRASDSSHQSQAQHEPQTKSPPREQHSEHEQEGEHRASEVARIEAMVHDAEAAAELPTQQTLKRIDMSMRGQRGSLSVLGLENSARISVRALRNITPSRWRGDSQVLEGQKPADRLQMSSNVSEEERLSLTIAKSDFANMRVIGQFNLGFILALRCATTTQSDDLFIVDQHASDEIYNFSRLSQTTVLTPQLLVQPHVLQMTAIEEETILAHKDSTLVKNGFRVDVDMSGTSLVGKRCRLLTVPTSRETVFGLEDLDELLVLLNDIPAPTSVVVDHKPLLRPSKVRRMLAMRACRSSIMVGHTLTAKGMGKILRQMGEIDRPWNCPHGRPTMRHLAGLSKWDTWNEDDGLGTDPRGASRTDWKGWVQLLRHEIEA